MEKVIYTRESRSESADASTEELIDEIMKRPLFLNYSPHRYGIFKNFFAGSGDQFENHQCVGSSIDGTKVGKVYDVGDYDMLVYSDYLTFDVDDELLFEYRNDDPYFFRIPQPEILRNETSTIDGKYMPANDLRFFNERLFPSEATKDYSIEPTIVIPEERKVSLLKCASTFTVHCSTTSLVKDKSTPPPGDVMNSSDCATWLTEHLLLTYLLHVKNRDEIQFVRELLFNYPKGDLEEIKKTLKLCFSTWKEDCQKAIFSFFDSLYFGSNKLKNYSASPCQQKTQFSRTIDSGPHGEYSIDLVPAIKCRGWPRPAMNWKNRPRQWPNENVIKDIVSSGFEIVAKSPPINPTLEKDFILSFSRSEIKLIQALPVKAKMSYRVLKMCYKVVKADVSDGPTLKSFHLKSALLWVAEQTDPNTWESEGILWGIRSIIKFLLSSFKQQHLPAFFVPESNLISHFRMHDIKRVSETLRSIGENPASYIKLLIDKEIEYTGKTIPPDQFHQVFDSFNSQNYDWDSFVKKFIARIFSHEDKITKVTTSSFVDQFLKDTLGLHEEKGIDETEQVITDAQLKYIDTFAKTVSCLEMDLFNVFDIEIDKTLFDLPIDWEWLDADTLGLYPFYDVDKDKHCGEYIESAVKKFLKFYANIFDSLCDMLLLIGDVPAMLAGNQDFKYIVTFMNRLKQEYRYSYEDVKHLLHSLLYFCNFTRLRHFSMTMENQILRSIREFLQNAQVLMTIYFNPQAVVSIPVVCDKISLLETISSEMN